MKSYWEIIDNSQCQQSSPIIFVQRRDFQQVITQFGEIFNIKRANTTGETNKEQVSEATLQFIDRMCWWWWWWWW